MKPILILYATREGHTLRVAERVAATVRSLGYSAELVDAAHIAAGFSMERYSAALVAASVHMGRHEREMAGFVKRHASELERIPDLFLSISLSEAGAEDTNAPPERRAQSAKNAEAQMETFFDQTSWHPDNVHAVAGALRYTKYNPLKRFLLKQIARSSGAPTDTSRDHVFTDWNALDGVVHAFLQKIPREALV